MQRYRFLIIILVAINVVLLCICSYFYVTKDRKAPKIAFAQNDLIYNDNTSESDLLKGINALDSKDGDLSSRIVVEKIINDAERASVVVYYAVCDYDGNVAKASRVFSTNGKNNVDEIIKNSSEVSNETENNRDNEADITSDTTSDLGNIQDNSEEVVSLEEIGENTDENNASDDKAAEEQRQAEVEQQTEKDKQAEIDKNIEEEKNLEKAKEEAEKEGKPYIELSYSEYKISKGNSVPWQEVIRTLRDDLQDYNYLFDKLVATEYDKNTPGAYPVTLFTTDASGNKSNTVTINIIVE